MTDIRPDIDLDLSETALDHARAMLGADALHQLKVYVPRSLAIVGRRLQGEFGFDLVVAPNCLFKSDWTWGAGFCGRTFWSEGCL